MDEVHPMKGCHLVTVTLALWEFLSWILWHEQADSAAGGAWKSLPELQEASLKSFKRFPALGRITALQP